MGRTKEAAARATGGRRHSAPKGGRRRRDAEAEEGSAEEVTGSRQAAAGQQTRRQQQRLPSSCCWPAGRARGHRPQATGEAEECLGRRTGRGAEARGGGRDCSSDAGRHVRRARQERWAEAERGPPPRPSTLPRAPSAGHLPRAAWPPPAVFVTLHGGSRAADRRLARHPPKRSNASPGLRLRWNCASGGVA